MPAHHFPVGSSMTTLHLCSDGTYLYWVLSPASLNEKTQKGHSVFMDVFHLSVSNVKPAIKLQLFHDLVPSTVVSLPGCWCRRRPGCALQTPCRRGLFLLAKKASLQSAWMSFSWVECHASEPPILPHWLLLQALQSPTLSKRNSLVSYQSIYSIVIQKNNNERLMCLIQILK